MRQPPRLGCVPCSQSQCFGRRTCNEKKSPPACCRGTGGCPAGRLTAGPGVSLSSLSLSFAVQTCRSHLVQQSTTRVAPLATFLRRGQSPPGARVWAPFALCEFRPELGQLSASPKPTEGLPWLPQRPVVVGLTSAVGALAPGFRCSETHRRNLAKKQLVGLRHVTLRSRNEVNLDCFLTQH